MTKSTFKNNTRKLERISQNLDSAFPQLSTAEKDKITDRYQNNVAYTIVELLLAITNRLDAFEIIENAEETLERIKKFTEDRSSGTILLTAHYSNWEMLGLLAGQGGIPMGIVRKTMKNPLLFSKIITPFRTRYGHQEYEREGALKSLAQILKGGRTAGLLMDEMIPPPNGVRTTLFSKPLYTLKSIAQLKLKYNPQIIPVFLERLPSGKFIVHIFDEEKYAGDADDSRESRIVAMTQRYNDILEEMIRREPSQWQWSYNRWRMPKGDDG